MHQIWTSETTSHDLMQLFPPLKPVRWFLMHQMCTFKLNSPYLMQLFPFLSSRSTDLMDPKSVFHSKSSFYEDKKQESPYLKAAPVSKISLYLMNRAFILPFMLYENPFLYRVQ